MACRAVQSSGGGYPGMPGMASGGSVCPVMGARDGPPVEAPASGGMSLRRHGAGYPGMASGGGPAIPGMHGVEVLAIPAQAVIRAWSGWLRWRLGL